MSETATASADQIGRRALRKASWRLIPLIGLGYSAAYIDRANISYAALQMNGQLHFSATVYGLGAGLFFLSYAACEIPSNLLLVRFGPRRWLARILLSWGLVAIAMLFVRTAWEFYLARFLLGVAEAGFFPGAIYYLMQWFPPELRARAVSRFYIGLPLSSILMGLIAGSLLGLNGRMGLAGWQWLFLVEGIPPLLLSALFLWLLPDSPADAPWLRPEERAWIEHSAGSGTSAPDAETPIRRALGDPAVWKLGVFNLLMLASWYGYALVAPDLVQRATHASAAVVGYTLAGMNILGLFAMLGGSALSDRAVGRPGARNSRFAFIIPGCLMVASGFLACGMSGHAAVVLPALAVLVFGYNMLQGPLWCVPGMFLTGRSAAVGIATMNMIGMVGGFLGPYAVGAAKDLTGNYRLGMLLMSAPMLGAASIMFWLGRTRLRDEAAIAGRLPGATTGALDSAKL